MERVHAVVPGGGSVQLVKLIDTHGRALAYDLQRIGVDLRDLWRAGSGISPRWVLWLVEQLPDDSAFHASQAGGLEWRRWQFGNVLLAGAVNQLAAANAQRAGKKPRPVVSLPQRQKPRGRVVTVAEIKANQQRRR